MTARRKPKRKTGAGRPRLPTARRVVRTLKLTADEDERWQAAASEMGLDSVSQLVRESVETAIERGSTR